MVLNSQKVFNKCRGEGVWWVQKRWLTNETMGFLDYYDTKYL